MTDQRIPDEPTDRDGPGYANALAELDEILAELEGGDVDVDRLADQVARAAELIAFCRGRIDHARVTIERVVVDLDADDVLHSDDAP